MFVSFVHSERRIGNDNYILA